MRAILGMDVGGQSIKAALVAADGSVLATGSRPTGRDTTEAALVASMAALSSELSARGGAYRRAGLGVAGVISSDGALLGSPNLPALMGVKLAILAERALGVPVVIDNDANCAALAETWGGAADGIEDFLLVTLGTGLGSGLVLGGKLHRGSSGRGCELGHSVIVQLGRQCGCGARGCLEAYVSESAARARVADLSDAEGAAIRAEVGRNDRGYARAVFELSERDAAAYEISTAMVSALGTGLGSFINSLDVECVVLGGGMAPAILGRLEELRSAMADVLFARGVASIKIVQALRGHLAGAIGAARLATFED